MILMSISRIVEGRARIYHTAHNDWKQIASRLLLLLYVFGARDEGDSETRGLVRNRRPPKFSHADFNCHREGPHERDGERSRDLRPSHH